MSSVSNSERLIGKYLHFQTIFHSDLKSSTDVHLKAEKQLSPLIPLEEVAKPIKVAPY